MNADSSLKKLSSSHVTTVTRDITCNVSSLLSLLYQRILQESDQDGSVQSVESVMIVDQRLLEQGQVVDGISIIPSVTAVTN
jgi:urease gamma subunit